MAGRVRALYEAHIRAATASNPTVRAQSRNTGIERAVVLLGASAHPGEQQVAVLTKRMDDACRVRSKAVVSICDAQDGVSAIATLTHAFTREGVDDDECFREKAMALLIACATIGTKTAEDIGKIVDSLDASSLRTTVKTEDVKALEKEKNKGEAQAA
jgi:hypothetical protein